MNRILNSFEIATISLFTISAFAQSTEPTVSHYKEGVGILSKSGTSLENQNNLNYSFSVRAGYHNWKDEEFVDKSWGVQLEGRISIGDSPLDVLVRGHYVDAKYDDHYLWAADTYGYRGAKVQEINAIQFLDEKAYAYGGSLQLQWNAGRGEIVNPYLAAGVMYEKQKSEADVIYVTKINMLYKGLYGSFVGDSAGRIETDDDGTAFVGRVGLEFSPDPFYARLEASYVTEIYEDDAQAELSAIVGAKVTNNFRIDFSGTYFTDWKEYYICAGFSVLF